MAESEKISSEKKLKDWLKKEDFQHENLQQEPVFYYSRDRRLNRASATVRAFNDSPSVKKGFAKRFFGSHGNIFLFISIIIICGMFAMSLRMSSRGNVMKIGGNTLSITITQEDGISILEVIKIASDINPSYIGEVDIAISEAEPRSQGNTTRDNPNIYTHRVVFHALASESFQTTLPFDASALYVLVVAGNEQNAMKVSVKKGK